MKIYFASGNTHKGRELAALLPEHQIVMPADEGIAFDPEETGSSFLENSLIKARLLWEAVRAPVLADDSGICVDALNGAPGIYSARYAGRQFRQGRPDGKKLEQAEQNRLLLEDVERALEESPDALRSCRYVCAMALYMGDGHFYVVQETMEGRLIEACSTARGAGGFGYDPLVIIEEYGRTIAELTEEEKNRISHRGKAARRIRILLNDGGLSG